MENKKLTGMLIGIAVVVLIAIILLIVLGSPSGGLI